MDRQGILHLAALLGSKVENQQGQWVRLQCPLAPRTHSRGTDRNPAFSVHVDPYGPSATKCWACDEQGTIAQVLERGVAHGLDSLTEALEFVRQNDKAGLGGAFARLLANRLAELPGRRYDLPPNADKEMLTRYVGRCARLASTYLVKRGLTRHDFERWRIGYDEGPTLIGRVNIHHRVVFPIWDEGGDLVGATMRTVLPDGVDDPKYRDWPGLPKGEVFYGEHRIDSTIHVAHLVEGILDVVVASRYLPNVLGLLGANTGMGPERLAKLRRWATTVVLILDPDTAGSEAVEGKWKDVVDKKGVKRRKKIPGLRDILRPHFVVKVAELPEGQDPAVLRERIVPLVRQARYLLR